MLFNTIEFVIFFIFIITVFVMIKNRNFQHLFLLGSSFLFFYFSSNYLIILLIFTIVWDYYFGKAIADTQKIKIKKIFLICSLAGNLGLLGFFKYADFAIAQFNILGNYFDLGSELPLLNLVFPIAISFYTFHSITYIVGIYRGQLTPAKSFVEYAIFVSFFPQLVAGPILRAKDFLPQLREKIENFQTSKGLRKRIIIKEANLKAGITLMAFGFFKKMFFADNIAPMVNDIFSTSSGLDSLTVILGAIAFAIQIYGDFSGYTDIAIGAALIIGFKLPINFNKPFFATSPTDFWNRWHISLSTWVRDYLYLPLVFGNRKSSLRIFSSLMITFLLLGFWHGAGWNYIIFGMLHGIYVSADTLIRNKFPNINNNSFLKTKIGKICAILGTQYLIVFAFIAFRVKDTELMLYYMQKFVLFDFQTSGFIQYVEFHLVEISFLISFIILHTISYKINNLPQKISNLPLRYWFIFLAGIAILILSFYNGRPEQFIYFDF